MGSDCAKDRTGRRATRGEFKWPDLDSTVDKLRFLESKSHLSDEQARLLHKMRLLRNRAAHGELPTDEVDAAVAQAYRRVAKALVGVLDKVR